MAIENIQKESTEVKFLKMKVSSTSVNSDTNPINMKAKLI